MEFEMGKGFAAEIGKTGLGDDLRRGGVAMF